MDKHPVILTQMTQRERISGSTTPKHTKKQRLLRNTSFYAAVSLCLGLYVLFAVSQPKETAAVMSHLTSGFEYDETLGKLQLVSNMLPESAIVFLNTEASSIECLSPVQAQITHAWTQDEPWFEYASIGDVTACQAGEIMTIVKNSADSHTVRILHKNGYESVYSGLRNVYANEHELISAGQVIGTSTGQAAFELRKDGISVLPVFSEI